MGHWQEGSALVESYLLPQPYDGLLMLAGFDCNAAEKLKTAYWAPRFMLNIPPDVTESLKLVIFPFLGRLRQQVASMSVSLMEKRPSVRFNLETLEFISACAVQDTLELADNVPTNPLVVRLQPLPQWQALRASYRCAMESGVSTWSEGLAMLPLQR
jgi:hypothetical protein